MNALETTALVVAMIGALVWLASVVVLEVTGTRVRAAADGEQTLAFAARQARVAGWVTFPGALLALIGGVLLVRSSPDYALREDWWVGSLLGIWIVAMIGSLLLRAPRLRAVAESAKVHGVDSEDVRWRVRQVLLLARGELLVLCVAIALVIIQPS